MGSECNKSICGRLAGCFDRITARDTDLYFAIQMVDTGCVQCGSNYFSIDRCITATETKCNSGPLPPVEYDHKTGDVHRNSFHDLFLFLYMNKIILASQSP